MRVCPIWFSGAVAATLTVATAAPAEDPICSDPKPTPGAIFPVTAEEVCQPGYTKSVRHVDRKTKAKVYRAYGIRRHQSGADEIDHLISLQLGGSNDIRNLWPESFYTQPWNAHVKDKLENRLRALVCYGSLSLGDAQIAIAGAWIAAYRTYVEVR
jgi:hypothetical protein